MLETLFGSVLTAGITAASFTACLIAALPATFMSAVSVTYFFQAPECLGLSTAIAYPVGIVAAALFLGIFIWRTLIVGKDDVAPLHAAKN